MDSAFYIAFSITVLHGAVKLSVARGKADSSRADVVLYLFFTVRIWYPAGNSTYNI